MFTISSNMGVGAGSPESQSSFNKQSRVHERGTGEDGVGCLSILTTSLAWPEEYYSSPGGRKYNLGDDLCLLIHKVKGREVQAAGEQWSLRLESLGKLLWSCLGCRFWGISWGWGVTGAIYS